MSLTSTSRAEPVEDRRAGNSADILAFLNRLAREYLMDGPDRRNEPRLRITLPVSATALDVDAAANPDVCLRAVTRDLSVRGIGLISQLPMEGDYELQLSSPGGGELCVRVRVLRCVTSGYYFDVGCEFATDD